MSGGVSGGFGDAGREDMLAWVWLVLEEGDAAAEVDDVALAGIEEGV